MVLRQWSVNSAETRPAVHCGWRWLLVGTFYCLFSAAMSIDRQTLLVYLFKNCLSWTSVVQDSSHRWTAFTGMFVQTMCVAVASPTSTVQDDSHRCYWPIVQTTYTAVATPTSIVQGNNPYRWTTLTCLLFQQCILLLLPWHLLFPTVYVDGQRFRSIMVYNGHWQTLNRRYWSGNFMSYLLSRVYAQHTESIPWSIRLLPKNIHIYCCLSILRNISVDGHCQPQ